MSHQRKLQVFISSTFSDLRRERQSAVSAILENGHIPAGMELFAAGDQEQMRVIRRWIDESDVFLLILGGRYGTIEPLSGKSYTHLEYEYAIESGKPYFAIVMTSTSREMRIRAGEPIDTMQEAYHPDKYRRFLDAVTGKMCKFADDEKDIKLGIWQSLRDLEQRHQFAGWISAHALPDSSKVLADVAASAKHAADLEEKNRKLAEQIFQLQSKLERRQGFGGRSFDELRAMLKRESVTLEAVSGGKRVTTSLLRAFDVLGSSLAKGVSNAYGSTEMESEIFHQVAGPLFVYGLTEHARVPTTAQWQRFVLSAMGQKFLTELRTRAQGEKEQSEAAGDVRASSNKSRSSAGAVDSKSQVMPEAKERQRKGAGKSTKPRKSDKAKQA